MNRLLYVAVSNQRPIRPDWQDSEVFVSTFDRKNRGWGFTGTGFGKLKLETIKKVANDENKRIFRVGGF